MSQLNNSNFNGNGSSPQDTGFQADSPKVTALTKATPQSLVNFRDSQFDQSVVLRQSPIWSRAIMVTMMLLTCFGVGWAYFAKIEQVVPAVGQLKPKGTVKEVQAPVSGVVKELFVQDGDAVKPGDLILTFDSVATRAELASLNQIRQALIQENQIYRQLIRASTASEAELTLLQSKLSPEVSSLLRSRTALVGENELLRTELKKTGTGAGVGTDEQQRLQVSKTEIESRAAAAQLEVEKIKKQLAQTQVKNLDTQASLAIQQKILDKIKVLAEEGGISQLQYLNQQQQVQTLKAEISQLTEEEQRLKLDIEKNRQQVTNTVAFSDKNILDKIADNKQRIASIDSQFSKVLLENEQRLADVNSKITQTKTNVKYQELRAPVGGTIFDLQAKNPGFVANATQKLLQIVPKENYIAEVFITNKDIGFVRDGMKVDVRIDSFPFSEFGDIKGVVESIGSDALPPDQTHQFYRFPARIRLNSQSLNSHGRNIPLQSGMSLTANIKVREERRVLSLFTELFTKQAESLKEVR